MFVQIFLRDDITRFLVATCNLAEVLLVSLTFPLGKEAVRPGAAKCLQTCQPQLYPVCPCRLFAPSSEIHLHLGGSVFSLILYNPSAEIN